MIEILIYNNVDIDYEDEYGLTGLMSACMHGYLEIVKLLINSGSNVNYINKNNDTQLTYACVNGYYEIVKLLLSSGVVINYKFASQILENEQYCFLDVNYNTMFIIYMSQKEINIIKLLTSYGYDYTKLCNYHNIKILYVNNYFNSRNIYSKHRHISNIYIYSKECLKYKNEIINIVNEYIILKNELFYPRASDIFSLFVLVSDDYYIIKY